MLFHFLLLHCLRFKECRSSNPFRRRSAADRIAATLLIADSGLAGAALFRRRQRIAATMRRRLLRQGQRGNSATGATVRQGQQCDGGSFCATTGKRHTPVVVPPATTCQDCGQEFDGKYCISTGKKHAEVAPRAETAPHSVDCGHALDGGSFCPTHYGQAPHPGGDGPRDGDRRQRPRRRRTVAAAATDRGNSAAAAAAARRRRETAGLIGA